MNRSLWFRTIALAATLATSLAAQVAPGSIEGRVSHAAAGTYLGNARVSVGAQLETFTDAFGYFRLAAVPAGEVRLRVFHTGLPAQERTVTVAAGRVTTVDIELSADGRAGPETPVKLDAFVVAAGRELSASALAINEQRFTQTIKTVLASDSFGDIADGNVGEFVKFLPGVSLGFSGGHASSISLGGMPPESTPITIDGHRLASAAAETRAIQLDQISINNMARVEISRSQTPDSPASGIGGTVNLIPKSAFERRAAAYTLKAFGVFRDQALWGDPYEVVPNYEVSAIVPLTKSLGFAINATHSLNQTAQYASTMVWAPTQLATSANLPATTPDRPYLGRYEFADSPKGTARDSAALSVDWRVFANDVLTLGLQYGFFNEQLNSLPRDRIIFQPGRVVAFGPGFTQGAAGAGSVQMNYSTRDVTGTTYQPSLRWRHHGPVWRWEIGGAFSRSSYHDRNVDKGFWGPFDAYLRNVTVRFDDVGYLRPGRLTVTDAAGNPVDTFKIRNYRLETVGSSPVDRYDLVRSLSAFARREFGRAVPVVVKAGIDYGAQTRDIRSGAVTYSFVGADGIAQTADDSVQPWFNPRYLERMAPWGLDRMEGISTVAAYDTFKASPSQFLLTAANEVAGFRNRVNASKRMTEAITAPYLRLDAASLLDRRLAITAGVRYERTEFEGVGPLINPSLIYQRDTAGNIVRNAAGQPVAIAPLATLAGTQLAYRDRGSRTQRSYGDFFPSASVTFHFRPDLIGRLAYARSISRPNFNTILPSLNLPDETSTARTISLTNPNLEPWTADSWSAALEYYFSERSAGLLSARAYRRDIADFWGTVTQPVTDELLGVYGIDASLYGAARGFVVSTRRNVGNARASGLEFDYRQSLTFLPAWARGVGVFANLTAQHLEGDTTADFTGFVQRTINWGVSLNRERFTGRVSVNARGRERRAVFTGAGVEPGTYTYMAPRTSVDATAEYRITRVWAAYGTVRNFFNRPEDIQQYGPSTPRYAWLRQRTDFRPLYTAGVKASF